MGDKSGLPEGDTNIIASINRIDGKASGGSGVIIDNCNFHDNIGRMPWCDIDSEDGWEKCKIIYSKIQFLIHIME